MANLDAILKITAKGDASGLAGLSAGIRGIEKAGKDANSALGGMGKILGSVTGGVLALGAGLSAAGVAAFARGAIDAADNMRDLSQKTGVSVEMLSKFEQQANMSGSNIDEVGKAMIKLGKNMYEAAQTGKGPAAEALKELGLSATDATGKLIPTGEQMLRISDRLNGLLDGARKSALAIDLMGKSGANIVPTLNEGREAIEGLNASFDQKFADDADVYNDSVERLGVTFQKFGAVLAQQFLPILQGTVDGLTDLGVGLRILNLPFAGDKAAEIRSIKQEIISLREERAKFGQRADGQPENPEDDPIVKAVTAAKQQQESFKAAVDQTNYSYQLLGATVDATSQAVDRQSKLKAATLDADIVVNNAAKTLLEIKLGQARTDGERTAILRQIQGLEVENARIQQRAQNLQLDSEIRMAGYRVRKEQNQLAQIQNEYAIARAMGQQTEALAQQLRLQAIKVEDAKGELELTKAIADEKRRGIKAETDAKIAQAKARASGRGASSGGASSSSGGGDTGGGMGSYVTAPNGARIYDRGGGRVDVQVGHGTRSQMGISPEESALAWYRRRQSFAGGGYTGNAPRSGGLDGRGGFMAVLHPRETVIDHTQSSGSVPNITIKTGEVLQMPDGSQWVSMADLEQVIQSLTSPAGRMAMRGGA